MPPKTLKAVGSSCMMKRRNFSLHLWRECLTFRLWLREMSLAICGRRQIRAGWRFRPTTSAVLLTRGHMPGAVSIVTNNGRLLQIRLAPYFAPRGTES